MRNLVLSVFLLSCLSFGRGRTRPFRASGSSGTQGHDFQPEHNFSIQLSLY